MSSLSFSALADAESPLVPFFGMQEVVLMLMSTAVKVAEVLPSNRALGNVTARNVMLGVQTKQRHQTKQ